MWTTHGKRERERAVDICRYGIRFLLVDTPKNYMRIGEYRTAEFHVIHWLSHVTFDYSSLIPRLRTFFYRAHLCTHEDISSSSVFTIDTVRYQHYSSCKDRVSHNSPSRVSHGSSLLVHFSVSSFGGLLPTDAIEYVQDNALLARVFVSDHYLTPSTCSLRCRQNVQLSAHLLWGILVAMGEGTSEGKLSGLHARYAV